ncbi:hypothetical protein LAZ67_3002816 [Cordylochernes scorpioides]|uniref:HMG box domain-containing protein n=1 Tax=Cordylochernes scorpioides TaxID=51811 RepID=A0ABY6KB92_9ARAC|nr:hypothetical protein LAZ67_3002816 [Cordylochernes scorpioides]
MKYYKRMKIHLDGTRTYRICKNCPGMELTPTYIFSCPAMAAFLQKIDIDPEQQLYTPNIVNNCCDRDRCMEASEALHWTRQQQHKIDMDPEQQLYTPKIENNCCDRDVLVPYGCIVLARISSTFPLVDYLKKFNIFALTETWTDHYVGYKLNGFQLIESKASGNHKLGRSSGGIIVGIGNTIEDLLECIEAKISEGYEVVLAGDLNTRTGTQGYLHNPLMLPTSLNASRNSKDEVISPNAVQFINFLEDNLLVIINGRTKSDENGEYTYISERGSSVVDYCIVTHTLLEHRIDLLINPLPYSDHMPMVIKMDSNFDGIKLESSTPRTFKKYKWASEKETTFFIQNLVAIQGSWNSPIEMLTNNFTNQIRSAMHTDGMQVVITPDGPKSKPWFDRECYLTKKALKSQLKIYIRSNSESDRKAYALLKKKYSSLLAGKKKTYYIEIQERLKEVRDSAGFWKTISLFKNRRTTLGNISIQKWQQFYTELLTTSPPVKYDLSIRVILMPDDELMAEISLSEITGEIARLKRNKACGLDSIPNEAIKALPPAYLAALKDIYNRVLKTGQFPTTWCKTIIHPIFKNGDADNPHNYRGIALLSNLAKLFSSIMKIRLSKWTENRAIIPENQAGFRKEHSCQDHIFTLGSLIQLTLRRKRRKFYAFFIDLKKAFDTVPQALLWKKLLDIGLNFRFINLIKNYYENMTAAVRWNNSFTEFIKIKSGVLQAALYYKGKALAASGAVWPILTRSKMNSFKSSMKLLDAMVISTLLYAAPVWANEHTLIVDQIQDSFMRRYLNLPRYTPGYMLRIELGRVSLSVTVLKLTLKFWLRMLGMGETRLPLLCLSQLWEISNATKKCIGFTGSIVNILNTTGFQWLNFCTDYRTLQREIPHIIRTAIDQSLQKDHTRITNSRLYPHYKNICSTPLPEHYLSSDFPLRVKRCIAGLRILSVLFSDERPKIFKTDGWTCEICGTRMEPGLHHHILSCMGLKDEREVLLSEIGLVGLSLELLLNEVFTGASNTELCNAPMAPDSCKSPTPPASASNQTGLWHISHVGIPGNELTDTLEKSGALGHPEVRESTTQLDERDLFHTIKTQCLQEWKSNAAYGCDYPYEQGTFVGRYCDQGAWTDLICSMDKTPPSPQLAGCMDRSDLLLGQDTTTTSVGRYCDQGARTDLICSMEKTPPSPQLAGCMDRSDLLHGQDTTTTSVGRYCDQGAWTDLICSMDKTPPPPPQLAGCTDRSDLLHGQDTTTTSVGRYCDQGARTDLICSMDKTPPLPQLAGIKESGTRKRRQKKEKDSNRPKRPPSAYFLYLNEIREQIKKDNPGIRITEITKKAGEMWKNVRDKTKWEEEAKKKKAEYTKAMEDYTAQGGGSD